MYYDTIEAKLRGMTNGDSNKPIAQLESVRDFDYPNQPTFKQMILFGLSKK